MSIKKLRAQIFYLQIFSGRWFPKFSRQAKKKIHNIASVDFTLMSLLQYLDIFLESFKKGVHKNFTKSTENHLSWSPLCNKAAGWMSATLLNRISGTRAFCEFSEIFKNIYFANAGVDKFLSRHPNFWRRNFTCAPNRAL